jgi:AAA domain-containing protein
MTSPALATGAVGDPLQTTKRNHLLRTPLELAKRCRELSAKRFVVESLIPARQITMLLGDSGIGKSPLFYQLALCAAAGVPFLGLPTTPCDVLILDYENGLGDVEELLNHLAQYLGFDTKPENLHVWSQNDCNPGYGQAGYTAYDIIDDWAAPLPNIEGREKIAFIDPLSGFSPLAEEKNSYATDMLKQLRRTINKYGVTPLFSHHLRKPRGKKPDDPPMAAKLSDCVDVREWFNEARGARSLINGSDYRIGVDVPGVDESRATGEVREEIALVLRGFARVRGEIGPLHLARAFDEDGEPLGYRRLVGAELLFNQDQEQALARLPNRFTTGDAKATYGRASEATNGWLAKCVNQGLIRKVARGQWEKITRG